MVVCSDGGGIMLKWLFLVLISLFVRDGVAHMMMHNLFSDMESCETICFSAFTETKASSQNICKRGCRLMSMIDFMAPETSTLDNIRESCYKSCKDAYADEDGEAACAFGCQSQLPSAEKRRKEMSNYYDKHMGMMSSWSGMHNYYSRMMECLMDKVEHQIRFGWYVYQPSDEASQVTVLLSSGGSEGGSDGGNSIIVEQKTSNYLETNLASVDRGATPNVKSSQVDSGILASSSLNVAEDDKEENDWLFCLEKRAATSKKVMVMVVVISLMVVLYFCVTSTVSPQTTQKMTIHGDLEYLTQLDDKALLIKTTPQYPSESAPPLPVKIPVHMI